MPVTVTPEEAQVILSGALVVFTGGLMVVTFLYYRETQNHTTEMRKSRQETQNHTEAMRTANEEAQRHTEQMEKSREAEFKPVLKPTISWFHGMILFFTFENIGRGAATDVEASWGFQHLDYEKEWTSPLVSDGQRFTFRLPFEDSNPAYDKDQLEEELADTDGIIAFEACYTDVLDKTHTVEETIDVLEIVEAADHQKVDRDNLAHIRQEVKQIREAFENTNEMLNEIYGEDEP